MQCTADFHSQNPNRILHFMLSQVFHSRLTARFYALPHACKAPKYDAVHQ